MERVRQWLQGSVKESELTGVWRARNALVMPQIYTIHKRRETF